MAKYQYKHLDDAMKEEVKELLAGEHGEALKAWAQECGCAAVEGCRDGIVKGSVFVLIGFGVALSMFKTGRGIVEKCMRKRIEKLTK